MSSVPKDFSKHKELVYWLLKVKLNLETSVISFSVLNKNDRNDNNLGLQTINTSAITQHILYSQIFTAASRQVCGS